MVPAARLFPRITPPVAAHSNAVAARCENFGRLGETATWLAGCRAPEPATASPEDIPLTITDIRLTVFAGDHGCAADAPGAAQRSLEQASSIINGSAPVCRIAAEVGAAVELACISLTEAAAAGLTSLVRPGSGAVHVDDAMTEEETLQSLKTGIELANRHVDGGAQLLAVGALGIGSLIPAAALTGILTGMEPVATIGFDSAISVDGWKEAVSRIRDAMFRGRDKKTDIIGLLQTVSSPDIAALAGFLAQAAARRTPVVLDGAVTVAAALAANKLAPGARRWWIASHKGIAPIQAAGLHALELPPLLDLGECGRHGAGAALALPLLTAAATLIC